jgi:hypothetical protein
MGKSKKGGLIARRKSALQRLEATYNTFVEKKQDKKSWTTHGGTKQHNARSYKDECDRLQSQILILRQRLHM